MVRICEQYLKKGSKVFVEGSLQTRKWQDQSGADRYSTEVVLQGFNGTLTMLDSRGTSSENFDRSENSTDMDSSPDTFSNASNDIDDEIPF